MCVHIFYRYINTFDLLDFHKYNQGGRRTYSEKTNLKVNNTLNSTYNLTKDFLSTFETLLFIMHKN